MNYICIDGNNLTLIAYAAANRSLDGTPLEDKLYAILTSMIRNLKKKFEGEFYVCWDTYGGTHSRRALDSNYKATRDHSKFDFQAVESCKCAYEDYGIKSLSIPKCEGDDALFVLCQLLKENNPQGRITVVSRDKDLIQIVQEGYANEIYDPCKKKALEIPWYRITEYKALVGDSSDNISGVKGIGPKAALKIISGLQQLNEAQKEQYEHCLNLVDAKRNPSYITNYEYTKEYLRTTN